MRWVELSAVIAIGDVAHEVALKLGRSHVGQQAGTPADGGLYGVNLR